MGNLEIIDLNWLWPFCNMVLHKSVLLVSGQKKWAGCKVSVLWEQYIFKNNLRFSRKILHNFTFGSGCAHELMGDLKRKLKIFLWICTALRMYWLYQKIRSRPTFKSKNQIILSVTAFNNEPYYKRTMTIIDKNLGRSLLWYDFKYNFRLEFGCSLSICQIVFQKFCRFWPQLCHLP